MLIFQVLLLNRIIETSHFLSLFYPDKLGDLSELAPGAPALLKGTKVTKLDPTNQKVTLSSGEVIKYGKCLLAPGTAPFQEPLGFN